jgi:hypothetical protein
VQKGIAKCGHDGVQKGIAKIFYTKFLSIIQGVSKRALQL